MTEPGRACSGADDRAAELALGLLTGRERAAALQHVAGCPGCRAAVERLRGVAESLLLLTPEAEPPPGFESDVLARIGAEQEPPAGRAHRSRWSRWAAVAAVVAVVVGGAGVLRWDSGRGEPVASAAMVAGSGRDVGRVWRYDGDPSWLFVSVPGWMRWESPAEARGAGGGYRLRVALAGGRTVELDRVSFDGTAGSWGTTTPFDAADVRSVSVIDESGRVWCTGRFG